MKLKNTILILLIVGLSACSCSENTAKVYDLDQQRFADAKTLEEFIQGTDPYPYWRKLTINSEPPDLYIVCDGQIIGKTPLVLNGTQMKKLGIMGSWDAFRGYVVSLSWNIDKEREGINIKPPMNKAPMISKITNLGFRITQEGPALEFKSNNSWRWSFDSTEKKSYVFKNEEKKETVVIRENGTFTARFHYLNTDSSLDSKRTKSERIP